MPRPSPDQFRGCLIGQCLGDVDTTAAMTGAISGAHLGLAALPSHLSTRVHDRGTWDYDELVALADRCFELSADRGLNPQST